MARRILRKLLKITLALLVSVIFLELSLRFLLFYSGDLGKRFRVPSSFALTGSSEFWELSAHFRGFEKPRDPNFFHPELGWVSKHVDVTSLNHFDDEPLAGRRRVLMYGDSFAACAGALDTCWQQLLAESELGQSHLMLNYGVGGYGFDQIFLSYRSTIDRYMDDDPIVVVGVLVDDDLDRSILRFRSWPKPRFGLDQSGALLEPGPLEPGVARWLENHSPEIRSYSWRYLLHGTHILSKKKRMALAGKSELANRVRELNGAVLDAFVNDLEARGLKYFFVIFHGTQYFEEDPPRNWRENWLMRQVDQHNLPFVSSKLALREDCAASGRTVWDYYVRKGRGRNHYTSLGNQVVFRAIERGLRSEYDRPSSVEELLERAELENGGPDGFARVEVGSFAPFSAAEDGQRVLLRADAQGPTKLSWELGGRAKSFRAIVKDLAIDQGDEARGTRFVALVDGEVRREVDLGPDAEVSVALDLDLLGAHHLTLELHVRGALTGSGLCYLASPVLQ